MYANGSSTTNAIDAATTTSEPVAALRTSNQASMTSIVAATAAYRVAAGLPRRMDSPVATSTATRAMSKPAQPSQ